MMSGKETNMSLVVRARQLIDGTGGSPVKDGLAVVDDGRISYVGPAAKFDLSNGRHEVIQAEGTLLPGLIDAHVHISWSASTAPVQDFLEESDGMLILRSARNALQALMGGITTVRDCGSRNDVTFVLREAMRKGIAFGTEMLVCGRPVTITGGHCYYMNGEADGVEGVRKAVRRLVKEGADFIKVMATGGGNTPGTDSALPSYTLDELRALVDEAHRHGRRVAAHCHATQGMANALSAGMDTIEHAGFQIPKSGSQFDPQLAEAMAKAGVFVVPTISASYRYFRQHMPEQAKLRLEVRQALFRQMLQAGIRLAAGTDAGTRFTPSDGLPLELEFMVGAGMTPMQALMAATRVAAEALGIDDRLGALEVGKQADLVAVEGDPLQDITVVSKVSLVVKNGQVVRSP
ncbi:MAG: amidohydrolase family protein [Chloroflexota bacterium]